MRAMQPGFLAGAVRMWRLSAGAMLWAGVLMAAGCSGGKVATNGVPLGAPGRYSPAQMEIDVAGGTFGRSLDHVVIDLYGPVEFARHGSRFAPDARQAGFVLKPGPGQSDIHYWEYFSEGRVQRLPHQPGVIVLRGPDGRVSAAAVDSGDAGSELYKMLWGADANLNHLRASDPNGLALPLIRVLAQTPSIKNHPVFLDWYNTFQRWHAAEVAAAKGSAPAAGNVTTGR